MFGWVVVGLNIDVGKGFVMSVVAKKKREKQPGRRRTIQVRVGEMIGCDKIVPRDCGVENKSDRGNGPRQ